MWFRSSFRLRTLAALVALACAAATAARAATFSVDPISVTLKKGGTSATIAVVNQSPGKLRLQVSGYAWQQGPSGQIQLAATQDLVFFPQLLTLDPGETRRIRVGVTAPQGTMEKTYRVFMEELPSLQSVVAPVSGAQLTIRMKIGVPVFVSPLAAPVATGSVRNAAIRGGALQFDVVNAGNVHFSIQDVRVSASNASGASVFTQNIAGWYVLAGGTRRYVVPLSKERCAATASVSVAVKTDAGSFKNAFPSLPKDCSTASHR